MRSLTAAMGLLAVAAVTAACWDDPAHDLDTDGVSDTSGGADADADVDADADADASTYTGQPQGDLPPGWEGFGTACLTDEDCQGYSTAGNRRCLTDVLGLVNAPGGFCTACCDHTGIDGCAPNVDCVGVDNTYVICVSHCDQQEDCRVSEGWECRPLWYMDPAVFPGTFCMPDANHVTPDTDQPLDDPQCPWPWLEE